MAESFNYRLKFPAGEQKFFIKNVLQKSKFTQVKLADLLGISPRTLADWKREKFLMTEKSALSLSKKFGIKLPSDVKIRKKYWYVIRGGVIGGQKRFEKYGKVCLDEKKRREKWNEWWNSKGRFEKRKIFLRKQIIKPRRNDKLAEFVGILLGDGGINQRQITVTLHFVDDKDYCVFVCSLIEKLFEIKPSVHHYKSTNVNSIVISSTEMVDFLTGRLGLKAGNKIAQQVDIPNWIKQNKGLQKACLRGLVDTDGSVFNHRYRVNGRIYSYKKLSFTSRSKPLLNSANNIMNLLGIKTRISKQGRDVWLDSARSIQKYFEIVGSHNPKHLKKYHS